MGRECILCGQTGTWWFVVLGGPPTDERRVVLPLRRGRCPVEDLLRDLPYPRACLHDWTALMSMRRCPPARAVG